MTAGRSPADEFRRLHRAGRPLLLPNAWDFASAAVLARAGFRAIGTTSLGVAAGKADAAGRTKQETVTLARAIAALGLVTVDIEAGFSSEPAKVAELAGALAAVGVVGVNIEDGRGTTLARPERQAELIAAIKGRAPALFVNARIDGYWLGLQIEPAETLRRADFYLAAGADGIFIPGLGDERLIARFVAAVDAPLNVLFSSAGPSLDRLAAMGVRRVSCGSLLLRAALRATVEFAEGIRSGMPIDLEGLPSYADIQGLLPGP